MAAEPQLHWSPQGRKILDGAWDSASWGHLGLKDAWLTQVPSEIPKLGLKRQ